MHTTKELINLKKPALDTDILKVLKDRFSPRIFSNEEVKDEDIKKFFEAARWAPSAFNSQSWFFYYGKNKTPDFEKLAESLTTGNSWAKKAPLLILGCFIETTSHGKNPYAEYDLGQGVFSLMVEAQSLGYYVHQMSGFDKNIVIKNLNIKSPVIPKVMIAVGKIGDYAKADEKIAQGDFQKRERKKTVYSKI
jgi:nitroreductase